LKIFQGNARNKGQTTLEYMLTMAALAVVFGAIYHFMGIYFERQFRAGGEIITQTYVADPWD
jgi:uncharacterized protein (UPF0333 family)